MVVTSEKKIKKVSDSFTREGCGNHSSTSKELRSPMLHSFELMLDAKLLNVVASYETWGSLNQKKTNCILILHGLSMNAHVCSNLHQRNTGWWESVVGPGKAIDTSSYFVICVNNLGSCYGTTGPSSDIPESEDQYGCFFPQISMMDIAAVAHSVVANFGVATSTNGIWD